MQEMTDEDIAKSIARLLLAFDKMKDINCDNFEKKCPTMDSLEKDYNDFMQWAFGEGLGRNVMLSREKSGKDWAKRHPWLPIPRIFLSDKALDMELGTVCFFMDAYPLYIEMNTKCKSN
jgi:hypothetical protein